MGAETGDREALGPFLYTESANFARRFIGATLLAVVVALPAIVGVLGINADMLGYLFISLISFVIIITGMLSSAITTDDDEVEFESQREFLTATPIFYTVLALPFSALLMASTVGGYVIMSLGYPTAGLILAATLPYIDRWFASFHHLSSIVNIVAWCTVHAIMIVSYLYSIPDELPNSGWDRRKNIH